MFGADEGVASKATKIKNAPTTKQKNHKRKIKPHWANVRKGKTMDRFSEKALQALGDSYVYGLIDPRTNQFFYICKGTRNKRQESYLGKSIAGLEEIQHSQNPITYLKPFQVEKMVTREAIK